MARVFPQGAVVENNGADARLTFDNPCVAGTASSIGLHFGMRLSVAHFQSRAPIHFGVEHAPSQLEFAFCRGKGCRVISEEGKLFDFGGGEYRIGRIRQTTRFAYTAESGAEDRSVQVALSPGTLRDLLGVAELPAAISGVVRSEDAFSLHSGGMDARLYALTDEILECTRVRGRGPRSSASQGAGANGPGSNGFGIGASGSSRTQHLYLQGKALELVAALVDTVMEDDPASLCAADLERLHRAREMLQHCLQDPPSVGALAKRVGMGERRFKSAFKQMFGAPVMSYARMLRLEHARELLAGRSLNVTEVAQQVGYANASKFAAAYRKHFGSTPSARL